MSKNFIINYTKDKIKIISICCEEKTINTLSEEVLRELESILDDTYSETQIRGVFFMSLKEDFVVGADIHDILKMNTAERAQHGASEMQKVLEKISDLRIPTIALIHGQCLGGGLELTLACTHRIASDDLKTKFGFPEVQLGLLPGAGGTQRTPRLIGFINSLELILTGKRINSKKALKIGLIDRISSQDALYQSGLDLINSKDLVQKRKEIIPIIKEFILETNRFGRNFLKKQTLKSIQKTTHGYYPAPLKILDTIFEGYQVPFSEGLKIEARNFGLLRETQVCDNLIHLFLATTSTKKTALKNNHETPPSEEPISSVGIIGAGLMGSGIANISAQKGIRVLISEPNEISLEKAKKNAAKYFGLMLKRKKIKPFEFEKKMNHISLGPSIHGLKHCDIVIEAAFEDLELKKKLFSSFESWNNQSQIYASITSAIPIQNITENAGFPERVIGLRFFSPVEKTPLLEIIKTPKTLPWVINRAFEYGKKLGKQMIVVNDGPGFYTTRTLALYLLESLNLLSDGASIEEIDFAMVSLGFPVGPIALIDEVGIDVGINILRTMSAAFPKRIQLPKFLDALSSSKKLGCKNSNGFYLYKNGIKLHPDPKIFELLQIKEPQKSKITPHQIQERCLLSFINETLYCLEDKILLSPSDGDIGAVFGLGFPPFLGGPFKYIDNCGAEKFIERLKSLRRAHGDIFQHPSLIEEYRNSGTRFFPAE